jgi:hypothetical protein
VSTAKTVIENSLKIAGIVGLGKQPSGALVIDGLSRLNSMLSYWSTGPFAIHFITREALTFVASDGDYSIGTGANFNTTRPIEVLDSSVTVSGSEYDVKVREREEYDAISVKTTPGIPYMMYYEPTFPNGTLYFYFVPNSALTFNLKSIKPFPTYALADSMNLPPGYEFAIEYNLAVLLGKAAGKPLDGTDLGIAKESLDSLKNINFASRIPSVNLDVFYTNSGDYGGNWFK